MLFLNTGEYKYYLHHPSRVWILNLSVKNLQEPQSRQKIYKALMSRGTYTQDWLKEIQYPHTHKHTNVHRKKKSRKKQRSPISTWLPVVMVTDKAHLRFMGIIIMSEISLLGWKCLPYNIVIYRRIYCFIHISCTGVAGDQVPTVMDPRPLLLIVFSLLFHMHIGIFIYHTVF